MEKKKEKQARSLIVCTYKILDLMLRDFCCGLHAEIGTSSRYLLQPPVAVKKQCPFAVPVLGGEAVHKRQSDM